MDELVNLVAQKTGLPKDTAKIAVETVLNFLKQKLPPALAGQVDGLLSGGSQLGDIEQGLSSLFGKK